MLLFELVGGVVELEVWVVEGKKEKKKKLKEGGEEEGKEKGFKKGKFV